MKAHKSELAERLLADPVARDKFRVFMATRKTTIAGTIQSSRGGDAISVPSKSGKVLVVPTLLSTKVAG